MRRLGLMLGLSLAAMACGSDSPTAPTTVTFAGVYSMQTINGQRLPFVAAQSGATSVTINSDRLTIDAGGTWSEALSVTSTQPNSTTTQTLTTAGTWIRSGNSIGLVNGATNATAYSGTFSDNRLDLTASGLQFVFTK